MQFDIITIFPKIFDCYFNESIIKRARKKGLVEIDVHNLRNFTTDKHKTVDDKPYGGGPGMVLKVEPIFRAVQAIKKIRNKPKTQNPKPKTRVILFSAKGKMFTQKEARRLAKYDQLIMICGRYEGVDERVAKYIADEELSVGNYVLTGGEIPAMIVVDVVSRLLPGVLGKAESLKEESFGLRSTTNHQLPTTNYLEYPQYTRPENFRGWKVPKVLLSGDHKKIEEWRKKHSELN